MRTDHPLISVIVPMYNAAGTVADTLRSVRAQTHRELEIVVVDDGSTDASPEIVAAHAKADSRIRLLRQANSGVAAARNLGAQHTQGSFIAPVDADDLWAPDKLERQLAAMQVGGDTVGLAYTWFAQIDEHGRVLSNSHRPEHEGWVLRELCRNNFIGNGSSAMIRRSAFERVGGYDPSLRARRGQGCEDLDIGLRIAEHYELRVIREHLTGYRQSASNMSSDVAQMLRSFELVAAGLAQRRPELAGDINRRWTSLANWLLHKSLRYGRVSQAAWLARAILARQGVAGLRQVLRAAPNFITAALPAPLRNHLRRMRDDETESAPYFLGAPGST